MKISQKTVDAIRAEYMPYDRNAARQDAEVSMIWDLNAEELMTVANKRLCMKADPTTRLIVNEMCETVRGVCPEIYGLLVPACCYNGGFCHEIESCGLGAEIALQIITGAE